ncbi:MAG: hypothetical protein M3Y08_02760 [Fibrobacterota bacterium]|nr:hypothetical protein [Fibrobacterota bacterium]
MQAQDIKGKTVDKLQEPIPAARICLLMDSTHCVSSDDTGYFKLNLPTSINGKTDGEPFRIRYGREQLAIHAPYSGLFTLEWIDSRGRKIWDLDFVAPAAAGEVLVSLDRLASLAEGIYALRITGSRNRYVTRMVRMDGFSGGPVGGSTFPLAKGAVRPTVRLEITKAGYAKESYAAYPDAEINWITLTALGDSGYIRFLPLKAGITELNRNTQTIRTRSIRSGCLGSVREERETVAVIRYDLAGGKLYLRYQPDACRAIRLSGAGPDILGAWTVEDQDVELPSSLRPAGCPPPLPYSDPIGKDNSITYRISAAEFVAELTGESCAGSELNAGIRNLVAPDTGVHMIENTCRRTVWRNGRGEQAVASYSPHGGRDSTRVDFQYGGKTCGYVDPYLFADDPPACPDPAEKAESDFLACVKAAGFAELPAALGKAAQRSPVSRDRSLPGKARRALIPWDSGLH